MVQIGTSVTCLLLRLFRHESSLSSVLINIYAILLHITTALFTTYQQNVISVVGLFGKL